MFPSLFASGAPSQPTRSDSLVSSNRPRRGRWFFVGAGVIAFAVSAAGFGPSIIDQSARRGPPTLLVKMHATSMAAWLAVLIAFIVHDKRSLGRIHPAPPGWHRPGGAGQHRGGGDRSE